MSALTLLIGLAFVAVLAALLAVWFTLTLPTRVAEMKRRSPESADPVQRRAEVSNDAVRGAKAPRKSMPLDVTPKRTRREDRSRPDRPGPVSPDRAKRDVAADGNDADRTRRPDGDPFDRFLERGRNRDDF